MNPAILLPVNRLIRRRAAALLEVVGVYLTGAALNDKIVQWLTDRQLISPQNPFSLLTARTSNAELLIASRQLFVALTLIYVSFFLLILPIDWWRRRRGPATYGLTRASRSWKALGLAGFATAALVEWPVLIHTLVDAIHPLGAMAPWRQAFFDMSWRRWQYWLFAGILSYALIPVLEELLFRGYYQRRLAEDWGDGPAIIAVACLFTFSHKQYLIANLYNVTMIASLLFLAIGLGVVFAWTRSLYPSMVAHAIINVPMTPRWQAGLLVVFLAVIFFAWRGGMAAVRQVFANTRLAASALMAIILALYAVLANRIPAMTWIAFVVLAAALALDVIDQRRNRTVQPR
jgi:membrane protease YdiL (CAAX protease family)